MNYQEFQEQIVESIKEYLPERYADSLVHIQQVHKNNGVLLEGLNIVLPEENVSPTIYLNDYYNHYRAGREMEDILQEIAMIREKCQIEGKIDIGEFLDFKKVKDKIIFKAVGVHSNQKQLQSMPHRTEQDMALIYQILVNKSVDGNELLTITNEIQERIGVPEETLYNLAIQNTEREFPPTFRTLTDVMKEMMRKDFIAEMMGDTENVEMKEFFEMLLESQFEPMEEPEIPMYVLSNESLSNGASALFYPQMREKIAEELNGDFFVLPSSVHETLIIPDNGNMDYQELKVMVNEVNCTEVADTDILTGEVYFYDCERREFMIAGDRPQKISEINKEPSILEKLQQKVDEKVTRAGDTIIRKPEMVM